MEYILNTLSSFFFICFIVAIFIVGGAVGYIVGFLNCSKSYKGLIAYVEKDFIKNIKNDII
ncbi:hypothetical protein [Clostridium butyricum]|uniref:hypothetical protein n=1 Tax=Clostridium butyricum TaxID=1492 RepID=UPI003466804A